MDLLDLPTGNEHFSPRLPLAESIGLFKITMVNAESQRVYDRADSLLIPKDDASI